MRITIIATGSRGDVQPYIALGSGLQEAGHDVRLVSHENYEALVNQHKLEFWSLAGDVQAVVQDEEMRKRIEQGNFLILMRQMAKEARRNAINLAEGTLAACDGAELLMGGLGGVNVGLALAEKFDLPFVQAYYVPFTPTSAFPGVLSPKLPLAFGPVNRLTHHLARQVMWQGFRSADKAVRQEVLGLPATSFWGPYNSPHTQDLPILYGFSPAVIPAPPDWPSNNYVTGYWFLDEAADWTPPAELEAFLAAGPPPVYIGFGSMSNRNPEETAAIVLEALKQCGQRAILLSGWGGLQASSLPDSVFMIDAVPHTWLFPRTAAVVHHGGAGTTAAGLRAGVPSIIIPFFGDQPFWGQRVVDLGVGPQPIPRKKLTIERLAQAIRTAVSDQGMRRRAAELGARIQAEDGVGRAVEIVNSIEKRVLKRVSS